MLLRNQSLFRYHFQLIKPPVLHYEVFRPKGYTPKVSSFNKDAHKDTTKFTT